MPEVYVAAGSNVAPAEHMALAVGELTRAFPDVRFSPWYQNRPAGFAGSDFINLVAAFSTELSVDELLVVLRRIEAACGRPREAPRWAPRTMDLDVLLYGDLVCRRPHLTLPRPDLLVRAYMLGPLADLAPDLLHPSAGVSIGELWRRFDKDAHPLTRVAPDTTSRRCDPHPRRESGP
ncbi:MAG TPA: 2-amino-4-hydroxy-6-hydroxymethyldihydropteridine diphosphokinase [Steroidobacteraceae bacterium]|jgi:2-amino-4-hydroxy-6-hydroxymethyldihydropteridine diphosphokinase|nr:2-amino-4-hydroxy-6-hydroxymethyldihydropteridine diphosphokinase [Steroidobacteraceae bacterium]